MKGRWEPRGLAALQRDAGRRLAKLSPALEEPLTSRPRHSARGLHEAPAHSAAPRHCSQQNLELELLKPIDTSELSAGSPEEERRFPLLSTAFHSLGILTAVAFIANCTVLFFTLLLGIAANAFVVWAVIRQKSLQTFNNALLVNLAIVDLIRCTIDCPLLVSIELRAYGIGASGALLCDAQMVSFSLGCCVQLLTLASISAERYQAVANPFQHKQRRIRIIVWIPLTWTVGLVLTAFCMSRPRDAPIYLKCNGIGLDKDSLPNDTFGRYILIPVWSGCFFVIIGFYGRIYWIVKTHNKKIFDKGVLPPPKKKLEIVVDDGKTAEDKSNKLEKHESKKSETDDQEVAGAVCMMPSKVSKERASKKKEGKLAKRSGYIILTFVMFWTPLIVSILVNFFAHKYDTKQVWIAMELEILSITVACMTSATNPVTYAAVNPQFRTEFLKLKLKCKRLKKRFLKR
ncbi:D(3) dopamine receptor-like [Conger conger]|uniref:D(3) dopamine receptor-like n=1 Tax=Conger conger TaxID=82655 RepID=UPI002A5A116C|nr:D(3) dopamine receptor-like [Conger conger]